jgi:adenylate kinase family enzyme
MRVLVTGNAGAGKSTMAAKLGASWDLPVFGLDTIVWRPGWKSTPANERKAELAELIAKPAWVVDGVSSTVANAADLVVFLDYPPSVCTLRCLRRNAPYMFRSRPGLPEGCPEWKILPRLLKIIWQFPGKVRPVILESGRSMAEGRVFEHISNDQERDAFLRAAASGYADLRRRADQARGRADRSPPQGGLEECAT